MKRIFFTFSLILLLLASNFGYATGQAPDYLIQGKDTLAVHSNPLEAYFKLNPIKEGIITLHSTGLWRGYIAYFKIINNKLIVHDIYKEDYSIDENGKHQEKLISIYDEVFGKNKNFECNFYSGVLICPSGKMLEYVHMGYSSTYENYKLIEIKDGMFVKEESFSSEEFMTLKFKHFESFKKTLEYKKMLEETINMFKEMDSDMKFSGISKEEKKRKKQNKYLYEKEKEIERQKSAKNFIFFYITNNIKTIDLQ